MIPNKVSQSFLDRQAQPGEAVAVVISTSGSGLGTFVVQGRTNKTFAFQFSKRAGAHILRFPASFWIASKHLIARELFDRNLPVALIPTVETWDPSRSLSELSLPPVEAEPVEEALSQPQSDLPPAGQGLAVRIPPTEENLEEARRTGAEDFAKGLVPSENPFTPDGLPELNRAWQDGFEEAERAHAASLPPEQESDDDENSGPEEPLAEKSEPEEESGPEEASEPEEPTAQETGTETSTDTNPASLETPPEASPADSPPALFELRGSDIFRHGTEERVGGLFDPGDHLRMARGMTAEREAVATWLATLQPTPPALADT